MILYNSASAVPQPLRAWQERRDHDANNCQPQYNHHTYDLRDSHYCYCIRCHTFTHDPATGRPLPGWSEGQCAQSAHAHAIAEQFVTIDLNPKSEGPRA